MSQSNEWESIRQMLGFPDEKEMLISMYKTYGSLEGVAEKIGFSKGAIRRRMLQYGIVLNKKGGNVRKKPRILEGIPDKMLFEGDPTSIARNHDVQPATVFAERRRRREAHEKARSDRAVENLRERTEAETVALPHVPGWRDAGGHETT